MVRKGINMKKTLLVFLLLSLSVQSGLPPTSSKGNGESTYSTTFKTDYDGIPLTRTGTGIKIGTIPVSMGGTGSTTLSYVDLVSAQNIAGLKNFTNALTITSNSANSLAVGPNGTTNPVFQVDSSTVSAATGVKVTGAAAGTAPTIAAISSGANEDIALVSKGTGSVKLQVNSLNKYIASQYAHTFTSTAYLGANTVRFGVTGSSDTTLTASTEAPNAYFNFGQTRQHATGVMSTQRDFRITPSIHSFVGASSITNTAALSIDGPSNGGTNATITNSSALWVPTSALTNVTNSYGLNIAATTGATNNYAAAFTGGSVGIGTAAPLSLLNLQGFHSSVSETVGLSLHNVNSTSGLPAYGLGLGPTGAEGYLTYRSGTALSSVFGHKWFVNDTEYMRLRGDGKLGIGTSAPSSLVQLYESNTGAGNSNGLTIEQAGTGDALAHFLLTGVQRYTMGIDNSDGDKFKIGTNADLGTSNLFTMTNAGMVGIGTAAPGTPIHVATTNATVYTPTSAALAIPANILATIENLDTTDSTASLLGFVTRSGGAVNRSFIGNVSNSAGGSIIFGHRTGTTSYAERMRIDYLGNLGIGTSSPNANAILDVVSTTKAFMPPRMSTAQKNAIASPTAGMVVYDSDMKGISFYNGTAWTTSNNKSVSTKTTNYTALQSDDVILGDATSGAITITLPTAVGNSGEVFHIKKIDSSVNAVTVATTSSQTIDGVTTQTIGVQYKNITVVSNGSNWSIL